MLLSTWRSVSKEKQKEGGAIMYHTVTSVSLQVKQSLIANYQMLIWGGNHSQVVELARNED
jgi:hypothetical protein